MSSKGAGGRYHLEDESSAPDEDLAAKAPTSLSAVEIVSFAATIGLQFWLARELGNRGAAYLFQGLAPERHVFGSLALALAAYLFALTGSNVSGGPRLAGAMLATVVSVALLYLLTYLGANLYVTGGAIALAAGASLSSRTGMPRDQGYPAALIAASLLMVAYAAMARFRA